MHLYPVSIPRHKPNLVHAHVGYMSQQFTLYNDLTAMQNIRFYGGVHGLTSDELRQRISEILHMAGLEGRENTLTVSFPVDGNNDWRWVVRLFTGLKLFSWMNRQPVLIQSAEDNSGN